jgi:hypothetical protein
MSWMALAVATVGTALLMAVVAGPPAGWGHGGAPHRLSERALQRLELRLLGPGHAAEHRRTRAWARRERARWAALSPAARRRERGAARRLAAVGDPATEGRWLPPFEIPVVGVHAAVLPTGKVMLFSQKVHDYRARVAAAFLWDPTKGPGQAGEFQSVPPGDNIWCGAQSLMADGQLLVTGGTLAYATSTSGYKGLKSVFTFDPWAAKWTRQPDMAIGRWYPTQTLLPDGRTLITSGYADTGNYVWNRDIDVFTPPAARGGQGTIARIGRYGELPGAPSLPHWYPHWFVMPSGSVLNAGFTRTQAWLLDPRPGAVRAFDRPDWSVTRKYGSAVLLPGSPSGSTRVMQVGGYDSGTTQKASMASTEVFDEATPTRAPVLGSAMRVPRSNHNTVLLPDRSMVTVGGGYGEQPGLASPANANTTLAAAGPEHKAVEIFNPVTGQWRLGAAQVHKRSYHSTALLLPDGRVLSAGDDRDPARGSTYRERDKAEIYEPPYLHTSGVRPRITAAPTGVGYGARFSVTTSSPIASAVLIAPGATTHANDMHQRLVPLSITPTAGGANLTAPANANITPPGYYMLFVLNGDGKPSVARWVRLGGVRALNTSTTTTTLRFDDLSVTSAVP